MADLKEVYETSMAGIDGALIQEEAAFRTASLSGDLDEQVRASQSIAGLRATKREYIAMAHEAMAPRAQAPLDHEDEMSRSDVALARKYGLTSQTLAVAKNWTSNAIRSRDGDLPDEAKVRTYIENTNRYRQARRDGSYRDDNGTVRR